MSAPGEAKARSARRRTIAHAADRVTLDLCKYGEEAA